MRRISFLFILTILFVPAATQPVPAGLYLRQAVTRLPLQDVTVYTPDYSFAEVSDENGFVSLRQLPAGTTRLLISGIGIEKQEWVLPVTDNATALPVLFLTPRITTLSDVVVRTGARNGVFKTISDLDIHLRPILNSQEVLRLVPGLFIGQHAGGGKAEQIFLRGFDLDHGTDIQITVDGLPVNKVSHAHGQGYADLHFVIPELIEKVSFSKGPYTADKGNLATAGFVAFRTRHFLERSFVKMEAGQFNTGRLITAVNLLSPRARDRRQSLYASGEASYTRGYFDSPQDFSRLNGLLKYHGSAGTGGTVTALLSAFTSRWMASGQIPDRAVAGGLIGFFGAIDDREGGSTSRYNASVEWNFRTPSGASVKQQLFYSRYLFELYSNFTFFKEDPVNGDQIRQKEARDLAGYQIQYEKDHSLGRRQARLMTGLQIRYDAVQNIELSRTVNRTQVTAPLALGDIRESNSGIWVQEKIILNNRWDISPGLRADLFTNRYYNRLDGSTRTAQSLIVSPKFQVNYRAGEKLQLYLQTGQGFHSNDTRVAVLRNGRKVVTPARGADLGGIFKAGKRLLLQTALWYLWLEQEFVYVGDEGVVEPGGRTRRYGLDLSLRYELAPFLYADADLSWANPRALGVSKTESYLPLAPRFTSVGGITYRRSAGWNGSLRYRYMANRPANEDNSVVATGYFVTDAALNYTRSRWEAGLAIQNLFNVKWKETQFDTESRLQNEPAPVSEIHFTPGTPFFARASISFFF